MLAVGVLFLLGLAWLHSFWQRGSHSFHAVLHHCTIILVSQIPWSFCHTHIA
ncbi:hypothetical protein MANES_02G072800v8 [Manihot esculenta]|uniref:TLC domain-containing protein n=1 Tax=Manihot esculenta TaxID=3983 RepID=A0A2C9WD85_MANES|nr:hypothetical protein MANES_02G072800v8 [Manihot esculenta]